MNPSIYSDDERENILGTSSYKEMERVNVFAHWLVLPMIKKGFWSEKKVIKKGCHVIRKNTAINMQ
jgi:hypothetical protein